MAAEVVLKSDSTCVHVTSILWEIPLDWNGSDSINENCKAFKFEKYEGISWYLQQTCNGSNNPMKLNLCLRSSDRFNFSCEIEGPVKDKNGKVVASIPKNSKFFKSCEDKLETILVNAGNYVIDNKIKFYFTTRLIFDESLCEQCQNEASIAKDLGRLLEEGIGDVSLCVGNKKVSVHKAIVAARSPVLAATLIEGRDQHHFKDLDWDVVQTLVRYMYTDHVHDMEKNVKKLYPVACKFVLVGLKNRCEKAIERSLTVENACETLILVDKLSRILRARVTEFMKSKFTEIKSTAGFKSMMSTHNHLSVEVCFLVLDVDASPLGHKAG